MKIQKKDRNYILIIAGLIILLILLLQCKGKGGSGKVDYKYVTDTLYIDKPYEVVKEIKTKTPPRYVFVYDTVRLPADTVYKWKDKIIIKTEVDSFGYNQNFLTQFPKSPKLLNINLSHDTMDIDILDTNGITLRQTYPMDFNRFKYQWYDGQLHHKKLLFKPIKADWDFKNLYATAGFDFFQLSPLIGVDYSIKWRFLRIQGRANLYLNQNPSVSLDVGLGFKLIGNGRKRK